MLNLLARLLLVLVCLGCAPAFAQQAKVVTSCGTVPQALQAGTTAYATIDVNGNTCIGALTFSGYPSGAAAITGNATGTTGAVVGTLAAAVGKTTYICGFSVDAIGGTAAVGPITIAGLLGSSMIFQLTSSATGVSRYVPFTPCVPGSATNTAITITTTADGTASAVDVNAWGYQQ